MSHILPESQSVIDQLKHDFVKSCTLPRSNSSWIRTYSKRKLP